MANALVALFVLDAAAQGLNESAKSSIFNNDNHLHHCNASYSRLILKEIANVLKVDIIPEWISENQIHGSAEYLYNLESIFNDAPNTFMKLIDTEDEIEGQQSIFHAAEEHNKPKSTDNSNTKEEFPTSAPFLAAILERLSNMSALTCAGSIISPRFVVTAGKCLRSLRSSHVISNKKETEQYAVIVGTSNPLAEGTTYNITDILYPPKSKNFHVIKTNNTSVVLMKTDVEIIMNVFVKTIPLANIFTDEVPIQFYGWIVELNTNKRDSRTVKLKMFPLSIMSSMECEHSLNFIGTYCLKPVERDVGNITHLMSGGAALVYQKNQISLLAVTQVDPLGTLLAYPLTDVADWLAQYVLE